MSDLENNSNNSEKSAVALRLEKARQAKAEKKAKEEATKEVESQSETLQSKVRQRRRKSMKHRGPLAVPEDVLDPNFQYRWVEDGENWNMSEKKELGYEFITDTDGRFAESDMVIKSAKFGNVVGRPSGNGTTQYLMKIPKDEYIEAKKLEREEASRVNDKPEEKGIYQKTFDIERK